MEARRAAIVASAAKVMRDLFEQGFAIIWKREAYGEGLPPRDLRFAFIATRPATGRPSVLSSHRDQPRLLFLLLYALLVADR